MRGRQLALVVLGACLLIGCGVDSVLDQVRSEPILEAPPGAQLVAEVERSGSNVGFGASTGRVVLWHYDGNPEEALSYYQSAFPEFGLQQHPTDLYLSGSRGILGQQYVPSVSIEVSTSIDEIAWDRVALEPSDITDVPPDGETLVLVGVFAG